MADIGPMKVAQRVKRLPHDHSRLRLRQKLLLGNVIEELSALT